jgi:DNA-binding transcriptional regulator YiaG
MKKDKKSWDRDNIVALRKHLGITQTEMAEQLGTRQQTISEWELGIYRPRGMSATLLNIVAERSRFKYEAGRDEKSG